MTDTGTEAPFDAGAGLPEPPWRRPARVTARRTPLSRDALVDAALRVLDRDGLEGLSMRRLGEELGTGAASLYWHVANKDELLELILDRVIGEIELPPPDPARWEEQLKDLYRRAREVLRRHGDVARISLGRIPVGPNSLEIMEWDFALLRGAGIPDTVAAHASDILALYLGAYAFEETLGLASPGGSELPPEQAVAMIGDYFASLPADRFPNVVALARNGALMSGDLDERFEFGLDLLVRGLAAHAPKAPKGPKRRTPAPRRARTVPTSAP
jgi:AcrR family transcriptional regulator